MTQNGKIDFVKQKKEIRDLVGLYRKRKKRLRAYERGLVDIRKGIRKAVEKYNDDRVVYLKALVLKKEMILCPFCTKELKKEESKLIYREWEYYSDHGSGSISHNHYKLVDRCCEECSKKWLDKDRVKKEELSRKDYGYKAYLLRKTKEGEFQFNNGWDWVSLKTLARSFEDNSESLGRLTEKAEKRYKIPRELEFPLSYDE